jgi:hypothetical protein
MYRTREMRRNAAQESSARGQLHLLVDHDNIPAGNAAPVEKLIVINLVGYSATGSSPKTAAAAAAAAAAPPPPTFITCVLPLS